MTTYTPLMNWLQWRNELEQPSTITSTITISWSGFTSIYDAWFGYSGKTLNTEDMRKTSYGSLLLKSLKKWFTNSTKDVVNL